MNSEGSGWSSRLQPPTTGRRTRRCPRLQTQVVEDLLDHRLLQDGCNDLQIAAAVRAVLHVELEHPLEQLGQAQSHRTGGAHSSLRTLRAARALAAPPTCAAWRWGPARRGSGRSSAMVPGAIQPTRNGGASCASTGQTATIAPVTAQVRRSRRRAIASLSAHRAIDKSRWRTVRINPTGPCLPSILEAPQT